MRFPALPFPFTEEGERRVLRMRGPCSEYPGVAQLVARVLWERVRGGRRGDGAKPGKPLFYWGRGVFPFPAFL